MKKIVLGALLLAFSLYAVSLYIDTREEEIVSKIIVAVTKQEKTLANIAEMTDRNGADSVVESIIRDCSNESRNRFDTLLNTLATLSPSELDEAEDLFEACARFYSSRKALMVARMEREFEMYRDMVELLTLLDDGITVAQYRVNEWETLVNLEHKRRDIFEGQVTVQHDIIQALMAGEGVQSQSIQAMLREAQDISEEALVVNQQIDALRKDLLDL